MLISLSDEDDMSGRLDCPVCRQPCSDPRLLPCFHTLCLRCFVPGADGSFVCPSCRTPCVVPVGGPQHLPVNGYVAVMVQRAQLRKQPPLCEVCVAKNNTRDPNAASKASSWCSDCRRQLCGSCLHVHDVLLPEHATSPLTRAGGVTIRKKVFCSKHPTEALQFHCLTCVAPICRDCRITDHEGHRCKDIEDLNKQVKATLSEVSTLVQSSLVPLLSSKAELCAKVAKERAQAKASMRDAIMERKEMLMSIIEDSTQQALKSLEEVYRMFEEDAAKSKNLVSCLKRQCVYSKQVLDAECDADILLMLQTFKDTFNDVSRFNNSVSYDQVILWDKSEHLHFGEVKSEDGCFSMDDWKAFTKNYLGRACLRKKKKTRADNHTSFKPAIMECLHKIQAVLAESVKENKV